VVANSIKKNIHERKKKTRHQVHYQKRAFRVWGDEPPRGKKALRKKKKGVGRSKKKAADKGKVHFGKLIGM